MEMEKRNLQNLENEVTCGICQEHYTDPKVLPCLHYYCKECILKLALKSGKHKPFSCPECRSETKLSEGGVDELKSAFFVNRFKSHFSALELTQGKVEVKCETCSSADTAVSFCRQCAVFICNACVEAHQRLKKMFAGHEVVSIQDLKDGKAKADITMKEPSPAKCPAHQELLKVYCFDCDLLICRDCTVKDHRDHNFEFSAVAAPKTKEDLLKELDPLRKIVGALSTTVKQVQTTKKEVEVQGDTVANTIHTSFNELFQIMEMHKQEMLTEAARLVRKKMDKLTVQEKNLSLTVAEVQSVVDYTERCVDHCTNNEVMSTQADIRRRIQRETEKHSKSKKSLEIVEQADMGVGVRCAEDLRQLCRSKAKVTQGADPAQCTVKGEGTKAAKIRQRADITLTVRLPNSEIANHKGLVTGQLKSVYNQSVIHCDVDRSGPGEYRIHYTPTVRGRHELTVLVDRQHVAGSPFPVFVSIHPTQLGKPVCVWDDIPGPCGIAINFDEEVLIAKKIKHPFVFYKDGEILRSIDSNQLNVPRHEFIKIVIDKEGYIYLVVNFSDNLMKLSKDGISVLKQHCFRMSGDNNLQGKVRRAPAKATTGRPHSIISVQLLRQSDPQQQKQLIGEQLYRQIYAIQKDMAGKITGMLLEMDNSELLYMLEVPESLEAKVKEVIDVLLDNPQMIIHQIAVVGEEVMVCERSNKGTITVYDTDLNYVRKIGTSKNLGQLCALATDSAHNIYAIDRTKLLIHVFTPQGILLRSFSCITEGEQNPNSLCVADQFVYVCNCDNNNVTVFTTEGKHVTTFGRRGTENGEFYFPCGICVDANGFVYICDHNNHRVQVF